MKKLILVLIFMFALTGVVYPVTDSTIDFRWVNPTAPDLATNCIRYRKASESYGDNAPICFSATESFTLTGLDHSTQYFGVVTALDDSGNESVFSNEGTATTLPDSTAPPACTGLIME